MHVLVCNTGASHAIALILLESDLKEIGKVVATKIDEKEKVILTGKYAEK